MEDLESIKEHIVMYELYKEAYKRREVIINKKLEKIFKSIPVCGGNGEQFQRKISQEYTENKIITMLNNGEITKEEYDFYKMKFKEYMFTYGTKYLI